MLRFIPQKRKFHGLLCVLILLHGCVSTGGIGPREQLISNEKVAGGQDIARAVKEAGWPRSQWWLAYGDPQLDRWIRAAVGSNPDVAMAAGRLREAKAIAGLAESKESLQITGEGAIRRRNWPDDPFYGPGGLSGTQTWDNTASLVLSYPLDLWNRHENAAARFLDLAHMSAAQERMVRLDLQGAIVRVYVEFSLHYAERDVMQATLSQQMQMQQLAEQRLKGGLGTYLEVSQTETPIAETKRQIEALDEAIALSTNQLAALSGRGPGAAADLVRPHLSLDQRLVVPSALTADLVGRRPDVVASRWNVAAQARGIDVAHANFYPNIDLVGSLGYIASGGDVLSFLANSKRNYSVGPALSLPIFDGGRLRSELGQASAEYDVAVAGYNQTLIQALRQISEQLIRSHSVDRQKVFIEEGLVSAQRSFDIAMTAYQRGLTGYLEVLNAQTRLLHERRIQQRNQAAHLATYAGLMVALGGDVSAQTDDVGKDRLLPSEPPVVMKAVNRLMGQE
ncbi:efflux transporter outer membrane subunit [Pseudomonas sp. SLFW]|uniref:efflux transporter outer membrane subunit n=1 Tax=Pseudomonas sp. SLFW TaxID=2683259 RepID=UPI00353198FE